MDHLVRIWKWLWRRPYMTWVGDHPDRDGSTLVVHYYFNEYTGEKYSTRKRWY
jgi:hypothetical protein